MACNASAAVSRTWTRRHHIVLWMEFKTAWLATPVQQSWPATEHVGGALLTRHDRRVMDLEGPERTYVGLSWTPYPSRMRRHDG